MSLWEISRRLHAEPSAVQSMLDLLVRKGRLVEIGPDGKYCADCGLEADCNLLAVHGKRYISTSIARDEAPRITPPSA